MTLSNIRRRERKLKAQEKREVQKRKQQDHSRRLRPELSPHLPGARPRRTFCDGRLTWISISASALTPGGSVMEKRARHGKPRAGSAIRRTGKLSEPHGGLEGRGGLPTHQAEFRSELSDAGERCGDAPAGVLYRN